MRHLPTGTITLLFTDIEGSTRLLRQLGPRYADVLADCRALLRVAFEQWHGQEVDTQGDAFFVVFSRALDAVSAAVSAQRALLAHQWPDNVQVRVRMGIHTGEPQAVEEGYIGMDVHRAARIMGAAHGGQVLLSHTTSYLVQQDLPDAVTLRDLGEYHLKDIAGLTHLFQLEISGLPTDFPPLQTTHPQRLLHHFPSRLTPFIGRVQEIKQVGQLLSQANVRLLSLVGTAGVGKTRLAVQVATEQHLLFPGGLFFVALEQVGDADGVLPAVAQALDIQEEQGRPLFERVQQVLYNQRALLLLDNFEQVQDASLVVLRLLAACPQLKVLITSRAVLHVQAEHVFDVFPLTLPDPEHALEPPALLECEAIALFVQRAQAVKPGFQLTPVNAAAVTRICTRLDGIPLAIELAAARIRYFPPQVLLARLEQGQAILSGNAHDIPARQQTLQRAIAWSYELLDASEQQVFRRLAVFVQGGTLEAIEQVCTAGGALQEDILTVLEALVDKSLLQQQVQPEGEIRFSMLQTLREYGLERLELAQEADVTRAAHAHYYLCWAEEAAALMKIERPRWLDPMKQEYDNLRAALEWFLQRAEASQQEAAEQALRLCIALGAFWEIQGYFSEGLALFKRALAVGTGANAAVQAEALYWAGFMALIQEGSSQAEELLGKSQILFQKSGDKAGMANILRMQGGLSNTRSMYRVARRLFEEAQALYKELGDSKHVFQTREDLAQIAISQCNYAYARTLLEENLAYYQSIGESYRIAYPLFHLARTYFFSQDDLVQAQTLAERSVALFKMLGDRRFMGYLFCLLGEIHLAQSNEREARSLLEESVVTLKVVEDRMSIAESLISHARFLTHQGRCEEALTEYAESGRLVRTIGAKLVGAECLEGVAAVAVKLGRFEWAAQLWGTAAEVRAAIVAPMHRVYRPLYREAVSTARRYLGDDAFQRAWAAGRTMSLEQALLRLEDR